MELFGLLLLVLVGLIIVVPVVALVRVLALGKRVDDLSIELRMLHHEMTTRTGGVVPVEAPQPPQPSPAPPHFATEPEPPEQQPTIVRPPAEAAGRPPQVPVSQRLHDTSSWRMRDTATPPPAPPPIYATPRQPSRSREEWELLIGGNWLARIGAIVALLCVAFLVKYAFDQNLITPWLRIVLGLVLGTGVAGLGVLFHRRGAVVFGQSLIGLGISVLYLTSYASYNLYHLLSQLEAMLLMSAVTALAVALAVRCDAIAVSLLGLIGGFLTPLLLSGGTGGGSSSGVGLFGYIALLDIGLLIVTLKKDSWNVLEPLTLIGTWLTYGVWRSEYYTTADIRFTIPFLIVFWGLFYALDVYRSLKLQDEFDDLRAGVAMFNSLFFYIALYYDMSRQLPDWTALATILIALAYFVPLLVALRRHISNPGVVPRYVLTTITLLAIATKLQFDGFALAMLWAVEALALVWCGLHYKMKVVWGAALALMAAALVALVSTDHAFSCAEPKPFIPIANPRALAFAVLGCAVAISAWLFGRPEGDKLQIASVLNVTWIVLGFVLICVEVNDLFRRSVAIKRPLDMGLGLDQALALTLGTAWALYSVPLVAGGLRKRADTILQSGLGIFVLGFGWTAGWAMQFLPIERFVPIANARAGFLFIAAVLIVLQRMILSNRGDDYPWRRPLVRLMDAGLALLVLELVTVEVLHYAGHLDVRGNEARSWLGMPAASTRFLVLAMVWAVYSIPLLRIGLKNAHRPLIWVGGFIGVYAVVMVAASEGTFSPINPSSPVLNVRVLAFLIVALALLVHRRQIASLVGLNQASRFVITALQVVSSVLIFELVTIETWQGFSPAVVTGGHAQSLRQLALSVAWLVYSFGLLSYGIWRRVAALRYIAISIYTVTILKVFLSDLSFLDTLYRIFSFLALGFILLLTSYLYQRFKEVILATDTSHQRQADPQAG